MTSYRIVQRGHAFTPQARRWWWPFWLTCAGAPRPGYGHIGLGLPPCPFSSLADAAMAIRDHARRAAPAPKIIHRVILPDGSIPHVIATIESPDGPVDLAVSQGEPLQSLSIDGFTPPFGPNYCPHCRRPFSADVPRNKDITHLCDRCEGNLGRDRGND